MNVDIALALLVAFSLTWSIICIHHLVIVAINFWRK